MTSVAHRLRFYGAAYAGWLLCVFALTGGTSEDFYTWVTSWSQWDAAHYLSMWQRGYSWANPEGMYKELVYPPGFPFLVGFLSQLLSISFASTAFILNICAYCVFATWQRSC
jgi:hypothetical protein